MTRIVVQNIVASAKLKHGIDLDAVVKAFPHVEYRPESFPGLIFRLKKPRSCTLIFKNGKMVCTGTKSEREALRAVRKVVRELKKAGVIIRSSKPEVAVQNVVATVDLGEVSIDLIGVAYKLRRRVIYEPEQFPGLIYRMEDPKVTFLIFTNGKLVCVGAKKEEDIHRAVDKLKRCLTT